MKFATFTTSNNKLPRYGFKKGNYIVDILHLSKFYEEKNKDERFINLPSSLKSCLKNWKENLKQNLICKYPFLPGLARNCRKKRLGIIMFGG